GMVGMLVYLSLCNMDRVFKHVVELSNAGAIGENDAIFRTPIKRYHLASPVGMRLHPTNITHIPTEKGHSKVGKRCSDHSADRLTRLPNKSNCGKVLVHKHTMVQVFREVSYALAHAVMLIRPNAKRAF